MTQHSFIKISNDTLRPATPAAREYLHSKVKWGDVLYADFKKARNPRFHRKYFALLNLGYEYWEPTGGTISPEEKALVRGYVQFLAHFAGSEDVLQSAADEYLAGISKNRVQNITATKSFDAFRRWATVESGHYDIYEMPNAVCTVNLVQSVSPKWKRWNFRNFIKITRILLKPSLKYLSLSRKFSVMAFSI